MNESKHNLKKTSNFLYNAIVKSVLKNITLIQRKMHFFSKGENKNEF